MSAQLSLILSNGTVIEYTKDQYVEQLSIPVDRGVSGDLRFGVLIAV